VIGGVAAQSRGWPDVTQDIDVTPARDTENLTRLAAALTELDARFRVDEQRHPDGFKAPGGLDARTFRDQLAVALTTPHGHLDVCLIPDGFPRGYEDLISTPRPSRSPRRPARRTSQPPQTSCTQRPPPGARRTATCCPSCAPRSSAPAA